jgi:hypothetical protein
MDALDRRRQTRRERGWTAWQAVLLFRSDRQVCNHLRIGKAVKLEACIAGQVGRSFSCALEAKSIGAAGAAPYECLWPPHNLEILVKYLLLSSLLTLAAGAATILEAPRQVQVAYDVDVVVAGGSTYAVSAAVAAAENGASVFLVTDRPYLGEDLCMAVNYRLPVERQIDPLLKSIWGGKADTTPLAIKRGLDRALLDAELPFLTGSYPAEVVTDADGGFAGITMVNRSGRHLVKAKVLIDATDQSMMARQLVAFTKPQRGPSDFAYRVVGGKPVEHAELASKTLDLTLPMPKNKGSYAVTEYRYRTAVKTGSWSEIARIEQRVRTLCRQRDMEETSERIDYNLGLRLRDVPELLAWPGAAQVELSQFYDDTQPAVLVLGKYAAVSADAAKQMLVVDEAVPLGRRIGALAADRAKAIDGGQPAQFAASESEPRAMGEVRYHSRDLRTPQKRTYVDLAAQGLPILGEYDVVVVGGGTSGAPAAIGAAESGAKTLLIEYLDELGGVGTAGMVAKYWYGLRHGFTQRIDNAIRATDKGWDIVDKSEWLRHTAVKAGSDVWFRSYGCGAIVDGNRVTGIVVATPFGRGVVLAKTVIDSTGNSDIPAHAGAKTRYSIDENGIFAVQLAGFPKRQPGENHRNTCYALVDDADAIDFWHLMLVRRHQEKYYDVGQLIDSRERRRIVGDYMLTTEDILMERTFPDTLLQMRSNFDASNFPSSRMLLLRDMKGPVFTCNMPYRCFLPRGLDGVLTIGLGASAHRDAMTLVRMQPDLQNQGYAVGIAATMAAQLDGRTRDVSIKALQKAVIKQGILARESFGAQDSLPLPKAEILEAVEMVATMSRVIKQERKDVDVARFAALAKVLMHPDLAIPALKTRLAKSEETVEKINCASVLATLGDDTGRDVLTDAVAAAEWKGGYGLTSHRETHNTFSDTDRLVMALGRCSGQQARDALISKLEQLKNGHPLSDYVAISQAFAGTYGPDLVAPLSRLLGTFDANAKVQQLAADQSLLTRKITANEPGVELNTSIKHLIVAGMLHASGDQDGKGKAVLDAYSNDLLGQLARYADYLLGPQ